MATMATKASGIQLAPMRMGDLLPKAPTSATVDKAPKAGYVPPHMRSGGGGTSQIPDTTPISAVLVDSEFPTFGSATKAPKVQTAPKAPAINFKKAVDDHLEREKLSEAERNKAPEEDILKMTPEQLEAEGWFSMPLDARSIPYFEDKSWIQEYENDFGVFPTRTHMEEMEADAEAVFRSYSQVGSSELLIGNNSKRKSPAPLNDACLRYRKVGGI